MANSRSPGPQCPSENPEIVDDGTMCRARSEPPGSVCTAAPWDLLPAPEQRVSYPGVTVDELFVMCMAPLKPATDADIEAAARELGVEPDLIRAVQAVEDEIDSKKTQGYQGRATILFERHQFRGFTHEKFDAQPDLSNSVPSYVDKSYGPYSAQYPKLQRAFALDEDAALRATSWGKYQIMGNNYQACGYKTPRGFVEAMINSEQVQLRAFVLFLKSKPEALKAAQRKDWTGFAKVYNGGGNAADPYDQKLKSAYDKIHKSKGSRASKN